MKNRDTDLATDGDPIGFHTREFHPLSNFSAFSVEWRDRRWPTAEHAYQAAKFLTSAPEVADMVQEAGSPQAAKQIARKHQDQIEKNFYEGNISVMKDICRHKLNQHEKVKEKLVQSGDRRLVEDAPEDDFWGWGPDQEGANHLGEIWMQLRAEIKEQ